MATAKKYKRQTLTEKTEYEVPVEVVKELLGIMTNLSLENVYYKQDEEGEKVVCFTFQNVTKSS